MNQSPTNKAHIPCLTGLRAIAAFLVFLSHFPIPSKYIGNLGTAICREMYIGVSIFFVLSGFLITYRYEDEIRLSKTFFLHYFKNRIARIYPLYFILTTATFIFYYYYPNIFKIDSYEVQKNTLFSYFLNISFLRGFSDEYKFTGIAQGWTLTVEECFYALAPFILFFRKKISLPIQLLFLYLTGLVLVLLFDDLDFFGFFKSYKFMLICTFWGRCLEFYIGIKIAQIFKERVSLIKATRGYLTYTSCILIFLSLILLSSLKSDQYEHPIGLYNPTGLFFNNLVLPYVIGLLFLGLLWENTLVRKILSTSLMILLGKSSYAFYLIHMGILSLFLYQFTNNYLLNFPVLIIFSILLFKLIEEPLNKLIRGKKITNINNSK
jgi:peptidoglycan/LPS O-acetylase OafA/YrhL